MAMRAWKRERYEEQPGDVVLAGKVGWIARDTGRTNHRGEPIYAVLHPKTGGLVDHMTGEAVERNRRQEGV